MAIRRVVVAVEADRWQLLEEEEEGVNLSRLEVEVNSRQKEGEEAVRSSEPEVEANSSQQEVEEAWFPHLLALPPPPDSTPISCLPVPP